MPEMFNPNLPDFAAQSAAIAQQRKIAEYLRAQSNAQKAPEGQMVGKRYVAPSIFEYGGGMMDKFFAGQAERQASEAEAAYQQGVTKDASQLLANPPQDTPGTPEQSATQVMSPADPQFGNGNMQGGEVLPQSLAVSQGGQPFVPKGEDTPPSIMDHTNYALKLGMNPLTKDRAQTYLTGALAASKERNIRHNISEGGTLTDKDGKVIARGPEKTFAPANLLTAAPRHIPLEGNMIQDQVINPETKQWENSGKPYSRYDPNRGGGAGVYADLPPEDAALLSNAILRGDLDPTKVNSRNRSMYVDVLKQNPDANLNDLTGVAGADRARELDFSSKGVSGKSVISINRAVQHLGTLENLGQALKNNDTRLLNTVSNWTGKQFGSDAATNLDMAKGIVAAEIMKSIVPGGGGVVERTELAKQISTASSPEQLQGFINTALELMGGQLDGLRKAYAGDDPKRQKRFNSMLLPKSISEMERASSGKDKSSMVSQIPGEGAPTVVRTGMRGNVKVEQLSDGTIREVK